jgi:tetratricopeptide (TPR) repeat protein
MRSAAFLLTLVLSGGSAVPSAAQGQHQHAGSDPGRLGRVMFENSCAPVVQERIGRAFAMLHSFWYEEVDRRFREIAAADPGCAIAWWGVGMAQWQPLWEVRGPSRDALRRGREALERGKAAARATVRERDYLAALEKFFSGFETVDHTDRVLAYERAMEALHARYPHDSEAAIFYALALLGSAASLPPDKTYARQKKAGEILQPIFHAQPEHPGVAHYIIHAYDYPALADGALDAARRYARIASDSPHALHMPSHIFTRLGLWDESIASNRKVVAAARKHGILGEALHGSDYLVFAHLQRGEDEQAQRVIEEARRRRPTSLARSGPHGPGTRRSPVARSRRSARRIARSWSIAKTTGRARSTCSGAVPRRGWRLPRVGWTRRWI